MKPQQAFYSEIQGKTFSAIGEKNQNIPPANLLEVISNPPPLLYSTPAIGMILLFVSAVSFLLQSFFKTIARLSASAGF